LSHPVCARITVNVPQVSGVFDYNVPADLQARLGIGSLVTVPFGKQTVQGIVVDLPPEPAVAELKEVSSLLDDVPVLTPQQIELAKWISAQYLSSLAACLDLMLPPGLSKQSDLLLHLVGEPADEQLTLLQTRIISLLKKRGDMRGRQLDRALPNSDWRKSLPGLVKKGAILSKSILQEPTIKAKTESSLRLLKLPITQEELRLLGKPGSSSFERRQRVLDLLQKESSVLRVPLVRAETGATAADLRLLQQAGLIEITQVEIQRDPLLSFTVPHQDPPQLTPEQKQVVNLLKQQLSGQSPRKPVLLQGVTSSGKTEVYLRAVEETLRRGSQAIVLVPEISLTPQTVQRFTARFPGRVALIHSRLSDGERYDTWRRIRAGQASVVVGARSALFVPLASPGLIVIDECHDSSYHQDDLDPNYHTVAAAIEYAQKTNAVVLLGSATPTVEQLYQFRQKRWLLCNLPNRVLAHQNVHALETDGSRTVFKLPGIQVMDMRAELVAGNRSPLSRDLLAGLAEVLRNKHQAILFLNRRGSASYVFCRDCGFAMKCSRCNSTLTYHENGSQLVCHRCNTRRTLPQKCPQCGSTRIKQFGLGTESLEKIVSEQLPLARLLRWDADTARKKGAHDLILDHFTHGRADILIGTQMIAKGLDLPEVTLVGMILADVSLNLPDFRAAERTFQLITQVAGRAGRSALGGKVILQTFNPDHYAIQRAAAYDFEGFEKMELRYRSETGYPPFSRLVSLEFRHFNPLLLENAVRQVSNLLQGWIDQTDSRELSLIGPAPCFYARTAGQYRWQIILRGSDPLTFLCEHPPQTWQPAGVVLKIRVDPPDLL